MFIIWQKQEQLNWFVLTDILLGDEPSLILPKFACSLISSLALTEINIVGRKQSMILHFRSQYPFQPIKFVNLVVPSPSEP